MTALEILGEHRGTIAAELCLAAGWDAPGQIFHARFLTLPRIGESAQLPHRGTACFRVADVRHRSAAPGGVTAHVRLLCVPADDGGQQ